MLIGNRDSLAIELNPREPTWDIRHVPERTAWAELSIWVEGINLCRNILPESNSVRQGVNVPLAPLTDWLTRSWMHIQFEERPRLFALRDSARDTLTHWSRAAPPVNIEEDAWLDAREHWWGRHFIAAGAHGAQLPNISLIRGDDRLFVEWARTNFAGARPPQFLAGEGQAAVPWDEAETVLAKFVAFTANWLRRETLESEFPWARMADPLRDMESSFMEKLQAYTGVSGHDLQELMEADTEADLRNMLGIQEESEDPGSSVITQVLRDLSPSALESVCEPLRQLEAASRQRMTDVASNLRTTAREAVEVEAAGNVAEKAGQIAAQTVRDELKLNEEPVQNMDQRMHTLGVSILDFDVNAGRASMMVGSRRKMGSAVAIFRTPRTKTTWGRRFELARALGHLVMNPWRGGTVGAASADFSRPWSRRCSGAFAAEFLLPSSHLHNRFKELDSAAERTAFSSLMKEYGVGATTAAYHLWNHGLLSSPDRRDDLIDEYSGASAEA